MTAELAPRDSLVPLISSYGGRTGLSRKELSRVEMMGRVKAHSLRLCEAAEMLGLSYRQSKRIWARYRVGGAKALQHGNCGRVSNRAHPSMFRAASCMPRHCGAGSGRLGCGRDNDDGNRIAGDGKQRHTLASWCSWEEVFMSGRGPRGCLMHMVDDATTRAGKLTTRGHFYCGQTGDTSIVV